MTKMGRRRTHRCRFAEAPLPFGHLPRLFIQLGLNGCRSRERCSASRIIDVEQHSRVLEEEHLAGEQYYRLVEELPGRGRR